MLKNGEYSKFYITTIKSRKNCKWIKDLAGDGPFASQRKASSSHCVYLLGSASFPGVLFLLLDEIRQVEEKESDLLEGLTNQQIFLWLQGLFLFALVWTVAGSINADSRKKFDLFFRNLIMGMDDNNPRPKSVKLTKNNIFPEKGNLVLICFIIMV